MKVKIINAKDNNWYSNKIGEIIEVDRIEDNGYAWINNKYTIRPNDFILVNKEIFVESDVEVIPRSFEIKCGTCTADLWRDEIDFGNYDVENIEDIIKVATKAKEIYDEYYAKEE